ncbi:MAG: hypothetical protein U1E08_04225 [Coriobacteriia bacterium]|nr:hypothetical protein [Coriobacteriia bacterium]
MGDERDQVASGSTAVADAPPAAGPPAGPPGSGVSSGAAGPRKKRKGCLIGLAVVVVLVLLGIIGVAVFLGQMSKPEDNGVVYTEADFDSALAKVGVEWPELPEGADPADYERVYTGSQPLDATLTEAELSALMSYRHDASYWPIKSMQVDLTGGDTARASGVVTYAGRDWAVSAAGSGGMSDSRLDVDIASATVAGIEAPPEYLPLGARFLEGVVNSRLARIPGFGVDSLEVTDEGVRVVGSIWESAEYVPLP